MSTIHIYITLGLFFGSIGAYQLGLFTQKQGYLFATFAVYWIGAWLYSSFFKNKK